MNRIVTNREQSRVQSPELTQLHKKLRHYNDEQFKNWKHFIFSKKDGGFYQGFDEIKLSGSRSTEKRFKEYRIDNYLSSEKVALDIGSNCGFFTLYISRFLKQIDGVEINPYLINISNETKQFLKIQNAAFYKNSFEEFVPEKIYDMIFSLANDETIDKLTKFSFKEYIEKISENLKSNGILIFESQAIDACNPEKFFTPKLEILKEQFEILENRMINAEYPINYPDRIFLILKKIH